MKRPSRVALKQAAIKRQSLLAPQGATSIIDKERPCSDHDELSTGTAGNDGTTQELLGNKNLPSGEIEFSPLEEGTPELKAMARLIRQEFQIPDEEWTFKHNGQVKRWMHNGKLACRMSLPRLQDYFRTRNGGISSTWSYTCELEAFLAFWPSILRDLKQWEYGNEAVHVNFHLESLKTAEQCFLDSVHRATQMILDGKFYALSYANAYFITASVAYHLLGMIAERDAFVMENRKLLNESLRSFPGYALLARKVCPEIANTGLRPFEWRGMKDGLLRTYRDLVDIKHAAEVWGVELLGPNRKL
jgi:hypothetical protein